MRAAIYTRVSTEDQAQGYSLDTQRKALQEMAREHGYAVAMEESDDLSGTTLDRPGLTRIRDAAAAKLIDCVLVYDPDRLTRKLVHQLILQEEFEKRRVVLEFRTQSAVKTNEDQLLLNVRGVIAEYERTKILERTLRGMKERSRRGLWQGPIPYGYSLAEGHLIINVAEAPTIRQMFAWAQQGVSIRQMVRKLNEGGTKTRRGSDWHISTIGWMLRSEVYCGRGYWFRVKRVSKARVEQRDSSEWIPKPVPAIIPAKLFAEVRDRLERNRVILAGRPTRTYMLSGLGRCECGARLSGSTHGVHRYYRCQHGCGARRTQADKLEAAVYTAISETVGSPQALQSLVADHWERLRRETGNTDALKRRAELLRKKAERGARALIHAGSDLEERTMRDELAKVRTALAEAEKQLAAVGSAGTAMESAEGMRREVAAALERVAKDPDLRREFLRHVIQGVVVRGRKVEIAAKLSRISPYFRQFDSQVKMADGEIEFVIHAEVA